MLFVHPPLLGCFGLQCIVNYSVIAGHFGGGEYQEALVISFVFSFLLLILLSRVSFPL